MSRFAVFRSSRESRERERERESRESGTVTCHAYMFKCPGWKFVGKVWNFCVLLLDDVASWWMFKWRSGALARAQIIFSAALQIYCRALMLNIISMLNSHFELQCWPLPLTSVEISFSLDVKLIVKTLERRSRMVSSQDYLEVSPLPDVTF